jgi:hypothetical protein
MQQRGYGSVRCSRALPLIVYRSSPAGAAGGLGWYLTAKLRDIAPEESCDAPLMRASAFAKRTSELTD